MVGKLVTKTGTTVQAQGMLYKVIVKLVLLWERELGGDRGHDKITRGIPSLGSEKNCGDDGVVYDEQRLGMAPSV